MIYFFKTPAQSVIATQVDHQLSADETNELCWLYGEATVLSEQTLEGFYVGPRREMITPWSALSYQFNTASGASIVLVNAVLFMGCLAFTIVRRQN